MPKLLFALGLYVQLTVFLAACWGWGQAILRWHHRALPTNAPLGIALGMGVVICVLQALAVLGQLNFFAVMATAGLGACLAVGHGLRLYRDSCAGASRGRTGTRRPGAEQLILALLALYTMPLVIAPLGPPLSWDELMYHLPHAREWALSGTLRVNEWLRYPWFPYNFDLLFAAALTLGNDVLPHLLHAATGGITAWLIYQLGVQHMRDQTAAGLAALIWLVLSRPLYGWAYVDMSVAMFILGSCAALQEWHASGTDTTSRDRRWLFACAFMVGVAAGVKYQVLTLLPFFVLVLAWHDRRPATWLGVVFFLCLPCLYWYARNALITGDPFNPVGGKLFGFTDWNLDDYRVQFEDLRRHAGWPHWSLWPALAVPLWPALWRQKVLRHAFLAAGYMVAAWAATSRYPRYLMFAFPLLALLSAAGTMHGARQLGEWLSRKPSQEAKWRRVLGYVLLAAVALPSLHTARKHWKNIAPTEAMREAILADQVSGYGVWTYLRSHPQAKVYQLGLEDSLYYAPRPIWGEIFGPWRYSNYSGLPSDQLFQKLGKEGFTALSIHTGRFPDVNVRADFERYFQLLYRDGQVMLYALNPAISPATISPQP